MICFEGWVRLVLGLDVIYFYFDMLETVVESVDAVVNLVGENFFVGCWIVRCKEVLRVSCVDFICCLVDVMARYEYLGRVLVQVSAVGIH